jgi:hypothetical protein
LFELVVDGSSAAGGGFIVEAVIASGGAVGPIGPKCAAPLRATEVGPAAGGGACTAVAAVEVDDVVAAALKIM